MKMILSSNIIFVFDLDDTLYSERDFEKSGINYVINYFNIDNIKTESILNNRKNWVNQIVDTLNNEISLQIVLDIYRNHIPKIQLYKDSEVFLEKLHSYGSEMALITDGRSITQRNKLKALSIDHYFKNIVISEEVNSEKPSENNFKYIMKNDHLMNYVYIADNPNKDFITPNKLGWTTICILDRGENVHKQNFNLPNDFLPQFSINSFEEIIVTNEN